MASKKGDITVRGGGFDVGEKVGLTERHGDFYLPGTQTVATATVDKSGEVVFKDQPFDTYWVHRLEARDGNWAALTYHHKERAAGPEKPSAAVAQARLDATRAPGSEARVERGVAVGREGVTFAGSDLSADKRALRMPGDFLAHEPDREKAAKQFDVDDMVRGTPVGHPTPKDLRDPNEASPRLAQEDARNVVQRSATLTGEAHPVDPDEPLPVPSQAQVDPKQLQRSATERGEAAPIPDGEASPHVRQEDARDIVQRSATQTGEAKPKPVTKEPETTRVKEAAEQKAIGHAPQVVAAPAVSEANPADPVETPVGLKTEKEAEQIDKGKAPIDAKPKRARAKATKKQGVKTAAKGKTARKN